MPEHDSYYKCIFSENDSDVSVMLPWCTKSRTENVYATHITNADNRFRLETEQLQICIHHRKQFAAWLPVPFGPLKLTYVDKFDSVFIMKLKEFLVRNCLLACINIELLVLVSPKWKLQ